MLWYIIIPLLLLVIGGVIYIATRKKEPPPLDFTPRSPTFTGRTPRAGEFNDLLRGSPLDGLATSYYFILALIAVHAFGMTHDEATEATRLAFEAAGAMDADGLPRFHPINAVMPEQLSDRWYTWVYDNAPPSPANPVWTLPPKEYRIIRWCNTLMRIGGMDLGEAPLSSYWEVVRHPGDIYHFVRVGRAYFPQAMELEITKDGRLKTVQGLIGRYTGPGWLIKAFRWLVKICFYIIGFFTYGLLSFKTVTYIVEAIAWLFSGGGTGWDPGQWDVMMGDKEREGGFDAVITGLLEAYDEQTGSSFGAKYGEIKGYVGQAESGGIASLWGGGGTA